MTQLLKYKSGKMTAFSSLAVIARVRAYSHVSGNERRSVSCTSGISSCAVSHDAYMATMVAVKAITDNAVILPLLYFNNCVILLLT